MSPDDEIRIAVVVMGAFDLDEAGLLEHPVPGVAIVTRVGEDAPDPRVFIGPAHQRIHAFRRQTLLAVGGEHGIADLDLTGSVRRAHEPAGTEQTVHDRRDIDPRIPARIARPFGQGIADRFDPGCIHQFRRPRRFRLDTERLEEPHPVRHLQRGQFVRQRNQPQTRRSEFDRLRHQQIPVSLY